MTTAFFKITSAIVALLVQNPPVSPNIYRCRDRSIPEKSDTAVNVEYVASAPFGATIMAAPVDWVSRYSIECFARSKVVEGDAAVDPVMLAVYNRLAADPTLGGLVDNIGSPSIEAEFSIEGDRTGWVRMIFPIEHRTQNQTLE